MDIIINTDMRRELRFIVLIFGIAIVMAGCTKEDEVKYIDVNLDASQSEIVENANDFGFKLLNAIAEEEDGNVVMSPFSAFSNLAMLANGDNGEVSEEIRNIIAGEASVAEINELYKKIYTQFPYLDSKCTIKMANGVWVNEGLSLQNNFREAVERYFNAETSSMDLALPASLKTINQWIEDKTGGEIKNFIPQGTELGNLVMANALYFKGDWKYKFDKKATKQAGFYLADGTELKVPMMYEDASLLVGNTTDMYEICKVPYGNTNYEMLILLPRSGKTPNDVLQTLTVASLTAALSEAAPVYSSLKMPKFSSESALDLVAPLKAVGFTKIFDNKGFNGIIEGRNYFNGLINQKTMIEVDEEGTKAASATVSGEYTSPGPVRQLVVNRPYIYLIRETSTGLILLSGKVERP